MKALAQNDWKPWSGFWTDFSDNQGLGRENLNNTFSDYDENWNPPSWGTFESILQVSKWGTFLDFS